MGRLVSEFIPSPNFKKANNRTITAVVLHYTASMTMESAVSWFLKPESKVSAHFVVGRDGKVIQMVDEANVAWHAGKSAMDPFTKPVPKETDVNRFSIGIELVGTMDSGFTDKQMASCYALVELLVTKYKIPPERVVGHIHIAPGRKIDPDGVDHQFNWAKTRNVAQVAYNAVTRPNLNQLS